MGQVKQPNMCMCPLYLSVPTTSLDKYIQFSDTGPLHLKYTKNTAHLLLPIADVIVANTQYFHVRRAGAFMAEMYTLYFCLLYLIFS